MDIELYGELLNATGRQVTVENCHWGKCERRGCPEQQPDGSVYCPMHFFRTSGDIDESQYSWLRNLETAVRFLHSKAPLAGRGCWAYPDMLEIGNMVGASIEWQMAHFSAWCIISAPLILGFDLLDSAKLEDVWPLLANKEAVAINQRWAGHPGTRVKMWTPVGSQMIDGPPLQEFQRSDQVFYATAQIETMQIWMKPQPNGSAAVLVLNAGNFSAPFSLPLSDVSMPARARAHDIWRQTEIVTVGALEGTVAGHACAFYLLMPAPPSPSPRPTEKISIAEERLDSNDNKMPPMPAPSMPRPAAKMSISEGRLDSSGMPMSDVNEHNGEYLMFAVACFVCLLMTLATCWWKYFRPIHDKLNQSDCEELKRCTQPCMVKMS